MERIGRISMVGRKDVTTGEDRDKGDRVGKEELIGSGVCLGSQSSVHSVEERRWEVQPRVTILDERASGDEK